MKNYLGQRCRHHQQSTNNPGNYSHRRYNTLATQDPEFSPYAPTQTAAAAILICGDMSSIKLPEYWIQDCSAATQNLLLAAHDIGLGAVWTGVLNLPGRAEGFRTMLHLPATIEPLGLVVLGYPAQAVEPVNRFKQERIHYNTWNSRGKQKNLENTVCS